MIRRTDDKNLRASYRLVSTYLSKPDRALWERVIAIDLVDHDLASLEFPGAECPVNVEQVKVARAVLRIIQNAMEKVLDVHEKARQKGLDADDRAPTSLQEGDE